MPLILKRPSHDTWTHVLDDLNNIVFYTRQEAISQQKIYRITFKRPKGEQADSIIIEEETKDPEHPSRFLYIPITSYYFPTTYTLSSSIKIKAVYIGQEELFSEHPNNGASAYVIPDGLIQDVIIHMIKTIGTDGKEDKMSFRMSPFFGTFELLQGFVKPAK